MKLSRLMHKCFPPASMTQERSRYINLRFPFNHTISVSTQLIKKPHVPYEQQIQASIYSAISCLECRSEFLKTRGTLAEITMEAMLKVNR